MFSRACLRQSQSLLRMQRMRVLPTSTAAFSTSAIAKEDGYEYICKHIQKQHTYTYYNTAYIYMYQ